MRNMVPKPLERSYTLEAAEASLLTVLGELGFICEFEFAGDLIHTCRCIISHQGNDNLSASGNGKGEKIASRVGSLFEAAEHLFSRYESIDPGKLVFLGTAEYCLDNTLCETLPLVLLKGPGNPQVPFLQYNAVNRPQRCFYPLALSCPSYLDRLSETVASAKIDGFSYHRLEHYSSNSGTAIGMNREEAIIHGLLENIERTSLSKFLVQTFLLNKPNHLKVIDCLTLPPDLVDLHNRIETESGCKVLIFEMPNKFGIPAYCSWMEQDVFKVGVAGYGCSLSIDHAISRSLYEVAQYFLLGNHIHGVDWMRNSDEQVLSSLKALPFYQDCAKFNLIQKCKELGFELTNYSDLPRLKFDENLDGYLSQLTNLIYLTGEVPFASEVSRIGCDIHVVHTFVTGEDRFFNVINGKSPFPTTLA
jgi:ribosomal protein S12 methylthiotransferase accessory factor